jgi:hypothetical protein
MKAIFLISLFSFKAFACNPKWPDEICLWSKARIEFDKKEYKKAEEFYAQIKNTYEIWPKTLIERAWTNYHLKNYNKALGLISTIRFPMLKRYELAETYYLEALIYFELCYFGDALKVVDHFNQNILPQFTDHLSLKNSSILQGLEQTQRVYKREFTEAEKKKFLGHFLANFNHFRDQLEILKIETLSYARKNIYEDKGIEKRSRGSDSMIRRTRFQHFYEFKEEFWADELGGFVYALEGQCGG